MRILIDECVPKRIRNAITGHDVRTVPDMGWSGTKDQPLLGLMQTHQFDVLLTVDQNIQYQQNVQVYGIAIIILVASSNRFADLLPLMPNVIISLASIQPGSIVSIDQ